MFNDNEPTPSFPAPPSSPYEQVSDQYHDSHHPICPSPVPFSLPTTTTLNGAAPLEFLAAPVIVLYFAVRFYSVKTALTVFRLPHVPGLEIFPPFPLAPSLSLSASPECEIRRPGSPFRITSHTSSNPTARSIVASWCVTIKSNRAADPVVPAGRATTANHTGS